MNINRFCSFSTQRALFSIVFCFLPISLSIGVLWNHLDSLGIFTGFYLILTKLGLLLVEITAIFFLLWELSVKDKVLSTYCFFGNIVIVLMMLLHVGSVFQYDSGLAKIKNNQDEILDSAKPLLELNNDLITKQGAELLNSIKDEKNNRNNTKALSAVIENTSQNSTKLVGETITKLNNIKSEGKNNISTLLPISYIESGTMYIVPILISFLMGIGALFISKTSIDSYQSEETNKNSGVNTVPTIVNNTIDATTVNAREVVDTDYIEDFSNKNDNYSNSLDNSETDNVVSGTALSREELLQRMRYKD